MQATLRPMHPLQSSPASIRATVRPVVPTPMAVVTWPVPLATSGGGSVRFGAPAVPMLHPQVRLPMQAPVLIPAVAAIPSQLHAAAFNESGPGDGPVTPPVLPYRPVAFSGDREGSPQTGIAKQVKEQEFMRLLDSLEVRVDLMAQMQHMRDKITTCSSVAEEGLQDSGATVHNGVWRELLGHSAGQLAIEQEAPSEVPDATAEVQQLRCENADLWEQLTEQRECIEKLMREVGMFRDREALSRIREEDAHRQVAQLHEELLEERRLRELAERHCRAEREQLRRELLQCCGGSGPSEVPITLPFRREKCGINVSLSEDGYVATRTRGCRQSVLVGSGPLKRQPAGWYFEVEIRETVEGWVGGLGVGVTRTSPDELRTVPDKAWRMPGTFMVGYWGCVFLDGKEHRTQWRSDGLSVGARVGVLVAAASGDLLIFADEVLVVCMEGALQEHMSPELQLYPVVDVFAATLSVALAPCAVPPARPWTGDAASILSPCPGSPTGSLASKSSITRSCFSGQR